MPFSPDIFVLRTLAETVLIGPRAAFGRAHRHAQQSDEAIRARLNRARSDPSAMERLRRAFERWRGGEGFVHTTDAALVARIVADVRRGRLAAWIVPNGDTRLSYNFDLTAGQVALRAAPIGAPKPVAAPSSVATPASAPAGGPAAARPPPDGTRLPTIADMSIEQRFALVVERALPLMPARIRDEFVAAFGMAAASRIAAWICALPVFQAIPGIGEILDLLIAVAFVVGIALMGRSLFEGARLLLKVFELVQKARTEAQIDEAAALFAEAVTTLGVALLSAMLVRSTLQPKAVELAKGGSFDKIGDEKPSIKSLAKRNLPVKALPTKSPRSVFRGDGRSPSEIFEKGFQPKGTSTDLQSYVKNNNPSAFVSTSKSSDVAKNFAKDQGGGYIYTIDRSGLSEVDVNKAFPTNPFAHEQEIAILKGIPSKNIVGAQPVYSDGTLGDFIPNPGYLPGK